MITLAVLAASCSKPKGFVISGKITNTEGRYLYLDELKVASSVPVDSVKLKQDGTFKFQGKESYPNFYLLRLSENNFVTLLVDTLEEISFTATQPTSRATTGWRGGFFSRIALVQKLNGHSPIPNTNWTRSKAVLKRSEIAKIMRIRKQNGSATGRY